MCISTERLWKMWWNLPSTSVLGSMGSKPMWESALIARWRLKTRRCIVTDWFIAAFQIGCRSKQIHSLWRGCKQDVLLTVPRLQLMMFYWLFRAVSRAAEHELNLCTKQNVSFSVVELCSITASCTFCSCLCDLKLCLTPSQGSNVAGQTWNKK